MPWVPGLLGRAGAGVGRGRAQEGQHPEEVPRPAAVPLSGFSSPSRQDWAGAPTSQRLCPPVPLPAAALGPPPQHTARRRGLKPGPRWKDPRALLPSSGRTRSCCSHRRRRMNRNYFKK